MINRLAKIVFAGSVFLLPVENALAVSNFNFTSSFTSADASRVGYMDVAGTWNGATDVTDTTGDTFTFTFENTGPDTAFDFDVSLNVPAGFRVPAAILSNPNAIDFISQTPAQCANINNVDVSQSAPGNTVNFAIPGNQNIPVNCRYSFSIGLTTTAGAATGAGNVVLDVDYNEVNNNPATQQTASTSQAVQVNPGNLALTKTAVTTIAANGQNVDFTVAIANVGAGGVFDAELTDTLSANLTTLSFISFAAYDNTTNNPVALPSGSPGPGANQYTFDYIPTNVRVEIGVRAVATINPTDTNCPDMTNDATVVERTGASSSDFATVDFNLSNSLQMTYDLGNSFCELCGVGTVYLTLQNTGGISLTNIDLTVDLQSSGLTYAGNARISVDGAAPVATSGPGVSGANSEILTWTPAQITELAQLDSPFATTPPNPVSVEIIFDVQRAPGFNEEGLATAIRTISADTSYSLICGGITQTSSTGDVELPIEQPVPQVIKTGRNMDAGQLSDAQNTPIVYGHQNDDVIWRVEVQNTGLAGMEDLLVDDLISGNFDINWVCSSEAAANGAAGVLGGPAPAGCVSAGGGITTSVLNFAVDDPFGTPNNDENATFIDSPEGGTTSIYFVGYVRGSCSNNTNSSNIEWGCEADTPDGGLIAPATNGGAAPGFTIASSADLNVQNINPLTVAQQVTGTGGAGPAGSKGLVTITLTNNSGGTLNDLVLTDTLPAEYVMDTTYVPTVVVTPAYGNVYNGMIDTVTHTNPGATLLDNTQPVFSLTSSTTSDAGDTNLLREGDTVQITFGIVLIDPAYFDLQADLDIAPELETVDDPTQSFTITNQVRVDYVEFCTSSAAFVNSTITPTANPEDLDVSISDALFILTNDPGTPLALHVDLTNNGGHSADDYYLYVSLGQAMVAQAPLPAGCSATTNPPPHPVWNFPEPIPGPLNGDPPAAVFVCDRGAIAPGATERFTFNVIKQLTGTPADDLTFRADVIGEITLSDGTSLILPAPASIAQTSPAQQLANNYSLDAIRSRVLGFNLSKTAWYCTESGVAEPPAPVITPVTPAAEVNTQIGEDCHFFIESGGWFGFLTPGFTLIAVEDVRVTEDLPNGQGFIPFSLGTNFDYHNTGNIILDGVDGGASSTPLSETDITWRFNVPGSGITIRDEFFRVNVKTRLLNDPVDLAYPVPGGYAPNLHAQISTDVARTSFNAIFNSVTGNVTINVNDTANIPGYPVEAIRRVDQTVVEPNLIVTKEVCNENLNGVGVNCNGGVFSPSISAADADAGDTQDNYIYRVTITNEASSGGVARSPAYNVIVTDVLDASDLMLIAPGGAAPFDSDGLDNDGDGLVDAADLDGEFFSLTENVANGGTAATFVISNTHSTPLQQIDPGNSVTFYYRIDPDDAVAPLQTLSNTVSTSYDSLEGDSGNQNDPQYTNAEAVNTSGRARIYQAIDAATSVQMLPLQTQPKQIISVSNSSLGPPQDVVVGEEILYELHAQIPVANLRNFQIRDELPPGIRCVDGQTINLNAAPYSDAGFVPGGTFAATCTQTGTNDVVTWNFGNQELTAASSNNLFDFRARFIARVENTDGLTDEGCVIRNGGSTGSGAVAPPAPCSTDPTLARLTYQDETLSTVTLNYAAIDVTVREPVVAVTKSFLPVTEADGDDILLVTVTATNNGTAAAYNLQILDDLTGTNTTYQAGSEAGTDPPDNVDLATLGANQPIFNWDLPASTGYALDPAESISFTFQVQVDDVAQPHEVLDNTIEARWTSLPSINTALNDIDSGGARTIAADGNVLGMRNGQLTGVAPISANPPNDYNDTASASVVVPELTIAKNVLDGGVPPTIGEHKQFEIVIDLPEGITNGLTVDDNLATTGLSYVLENDATFNVSYSFQDITSINGTLLSTLPATPTPEDYEALFSAAAPADEASGAVTWNIGTVDTVSENDSAVNAVNPQIVITYYARINNDVDTDAGDTLQNGATLNYTNGEDATTEVRTDNTPAITVIEPLLTVSKAGSNLTSPGNPPDAGDVIEYVVTIDNTGDSIAYDTNIVDTLPAGLNLDGGFTPTATINATPVAGFVSAPANAPAGPLNWGRDNGDETLDIPVGGTLLLTYRAIVQDTVQPNEVLTNTVVVDWTSLDGVSVLERDGGADCSAIVAPDDYCASDTETLTVPNIYNVTKSFTSDTYAPANDAQLRVGDQVTYTITLSLQEGTTQNITLVDTLPNGMEFVQVDSVNTDTAAPYSSAGVFTYTDIAAPVVTTGAGSNTITWTLGDIVNVADNNAANNDFVIVYTAQVVNDELPIPQNASTALLNTVDFGYTDATAATINMVDSETITAQEPIFDLADVTKLRRNGILSGSPVNSGDIMDFELDACNSGDAPAYDVILEDVMEPELLPATVTGPVNGAGVPDVYVNGALMTAGVQYTYALVGGTMTFTFNGVAVNPAGSAPNNCIHIEFDVQVDPALPINNSWDNSFRVVEYHSLVSGDTNAAERETYPPVGPVIFNMNNIAPIYPPQKTLVSPLAPAEATIGELVTYQFVVPSAPMNGTLYDVTITDDMADSLSFVSATLDTSAGNAYTGAINDTASVGDQVNIVIASLPATQQATITVVARVNNDAVTNNATTPFGNTVNYTFADAPGGSAIIGGGDATAPANDISIIEPDVTLLTKTVANITQPGNPPDAGDILRYTLTMSAATGAAFSDAFDVSIIDSLSLGLEYSGNPTVTNSGPYTNTIAAPTLVGDGVATPQTMTWALPGSNIDIQEGDTITITYDVLVLDSVLAGQDLTNSAVVQWTSLDGADVNERDGSGGVNDYISGPLTTTLTTPDTNTVTKARLSDTSPALNAANDVRIGDIVDYQITLSLQEGRTDTVVLSDVLPQGLQFEGVVSINGDATAPYSAAAPFSFTDIPAGNIVVTGNPSTGPTTVTWTFGDITNAGNNDGNDNLVIVYRARVLNLVQTPLNNPASNIALLNTANLDYVIATGAAPTETDTETVTIQQPNLTVTKTGSAQFGDAVLVANELVTYTVDIANNGQSPAYDVQLQDVIPVGLRNGAASVTVLSTELPVGNVVANVAPVYNAATGDLSFDFDSGVADQYTIPAGGTMRIVYQVQADTGIGAGLTNIINTAVVPAYHSFDDEAVPTQGGVLGVREIYGPSNTASSAPFSTPAPSPLDKANPTPATAAIGVPFSYTITVPDAPQATALYDVRILDNLGSLAPGVDLIFVDVQKVSVPGSWVPVNTGTPTNLVIEDITNGIDIPAGEQAVIELTVVLRNSSNNVAGDTFTNFASYTFNTLDNDPGTQGIGGGDTTGPMTVVEPLTMVTQKTGPAVISFGTPDTFSVDVQNTGTADAYDMTITDHLPDPNPGGMCDVAPTNFSAEIQDDLGNTQRTLTAGADFVTTFTPATALAGVADPTCTLAITMQTANARIEPNWHLVVNYDASLDVDNINNATLTNYVAATQWFSADTPAGIAVGEIRTYNEIFDPVLPGTPALSDHQDLFTTTVASPELVIEKTVINTSTGAPAITAEPGETLTYTVTITNIGPVAATNFSLTDEPDRLNPVPGYFAANTLSNVSVSVPATITNDPTGGAQGTGLLTVDGLNLAPAASLTVSFDIQLGPVITSGTVVTNQAEVALTGFTGLLSDDPSIPGADDPTQTIIGSVPTFQVSKTSQDISGDANVLARGDVLRYTITAKNIGAENSVNTLLRDQIPAHTTYVTNTTRLNGNLINDPADGVSPLQNGMLINAPENTTPGFMRASLNATTNVATVTFDVRVNSNVVLGTVISNQGFVTGEGAGSGPYPEQPSDNPATADIPNDPTVNIVGNLPIVDAHKTVSLVTDGGTPNVVDVNDVLEYRIVISNTGIIPATGVLLVDNIHGIDTNSNYVPNSITLNGAVVPDSPDVRPGAGQLLTLDINSSDLANPDQTLSDGQLSPGESAIVTFQVIATDADAANSIISNQGEVQSNEVPAEPTDADGNDENGDQVTTIRIGEDSELSISTEVFVIGGGVATPGNELEYVVEVRNIGSVDATNIAFTDVIPAGVTYVPGSARVNGSTAFNALHVTEPGASLDVDVQSALGPLEPDDAFSVAFRVVIDSSLTAGTAISNTASVSWTENPNPVSSTLSIDVGGAPGLANLNGSIWHDVDHGDDFDSEERPLQNWSADIYMNGQYLDSVLTDANGNFSANGLAPSNGATGNEYELRFRAPGAGANTASLGTATSIFSPGLQRISNISVAAGDNILDQNLPIEPNGIVYNAVTRTGVPGAQLRLLHQTGTDASGNATYETVSALCFDDPAQQDQITLADGYYKFELNFSQPSCPPNENYFIAVQTLPAGYVGNISQIIPPRNSANDTAFDIPSCPADNNIDALETTPDYCEIQASEFVSQDPPRTPTTDYFLKYTGNAVILEQNNQFYNNHIPLDPELDAALSISKTSALLNVTRSQLVPYTITITNTLSAPVYDVDIIDRYPAGFKFVENSARIYVNDTRIETPLTDASRNLNIENIQPIVNGLQLSWPNMIMNTGDTTVIKMLLVVGSGVGEGEYINRVQALNNRTSGAASGEASATVRVVPDPTFDCSDVIGKVFDDRNLNGYQDEGEPGVPGARVVSAQGLEITADEYGRFHITCAVVPNPDRGSNYILKLDERSLPSGYRVTTENPRVQRATRGKMLKYNFGAAIHRVVRLDMADAVFKPNSTEMRLQWKSRIDLLITELAKDPSVLRLSYMAEIEDEDLVDDRVAAVKKAISRRWEELNCCYKLMIETEVFWRTGGPPNRGELK